MNLAAKHVLSVSGVMAASVSAALAGPLAVTPGVVQWSGPYVGVHLGGMSVNDEIVDVDPACSPGCDGVVGASFSAIDALAGVQAGWNVQSGAVVLGVEADIAATSSDVVPVFGTVRGRLGLVSGPALFFVTAGGIVADLEHALPDIDDLTGGTRAGVVAGAGVEYALADGWSVKAEGLYYRFEADEDFTYDLGYSGSGALRSDGVIARIGINRQFGEATSVPPAAF